MFHPGRFSNVRQHEQVIDNHTLLLVHNKLDQQENISFFMKEVPIT